MVSIIISGTFRSFRLWCRSLSVITAAFYWPLAICTLECLCVCVCPRTANRNEQPFFPLRCGDVSGGIYGQFKHLVICTLYWGSFPLSVCACFLRACVCVRVIFDRRSSRRHLYYQRHVARTLVLPEPPFAVHHLAHVRMYVWVILELKSPHTLYHCEHRKKRCCLLNWAVIPPERVNGDSQSPEVRPVFKFEISYSRSSSSLIWKIQ